MTVTDELLVNSERYAARFDKGDLPMQPRKRVAVLACMDARLNVYGILGLAEGDAHIIRNAGGVATEDAIRSLAISQRLLGTREIILIHHTGCGMLAFASDPLKRQIREELGFEPESAPPDIDEHLKRSMSLIRSSSVLPHRESIRGFVYQVEDGRLREVR